MAKKGHFFLGFLIGGASALAATYLLTPQTSDELKQQFKRRKDQLADRAADYYDFAREVSADWKDVATDAVSGIKDKIAPATEGDLSDFDDQTAALRDELTQTPEVAANDAFDDIVLDGKSAFAQAKDDEPPVADEDKPGDVEEPKDQPEPDAPKDAE